MNKEILKKGNKGVTLIALVITIIVLLILAGIAVASLTGENGIMARTTQTRAETALGEAKDECALIATETVTDYYEDIYVKQNGTYDVSELDKKVVTAIKANSDSSGRIIKNDSKLGISVDGEGTGAEIKLTYTDTRATSSATGTVSTGKINWEGITNASGEDSGNTGKAIEETGIDYGGKTSATVETGDTISIDTEQFMVIKNDGLTILAMPYHNITLEDTPKQSNSAGTIGFSSSNYWNGENSKNLDMSNSANNIQPYIEAYQKTLQNLGAKNVTTRVARYSEMGESGMTDALRNPGQDGQFFLGTSYVNFYGYLWIVKENR